MPRNKLVVAKNYDEFLQRLESNAHDSVTMAAQCPSTVAWIFTGQSAQWSVGKLKFLLLNTDGPISKGRKWERHSFPALLFFATL